MSYSFIYTIVVSKLFLVEQYEMKKKKQSNNYVDNKKLLESMKDYIDSVNSCSSQDEYPQISDYIGECISLIAKGLATSIKLNSGSNPLPTPSKVENARITKVKVAGKRNG